MNERLVEDWLTKANERSFQTPFAQALLAEGMQVLRVGHSSHEHGKDIIAIDKGGRIHAYQLKDGDLDLNAYEKGLAQLNALVETQVEHPAITGQPKHQPWLVISGKVSIPTEDRIRVHNAAWQKRRYTPLKLMTGMQLQAKFNSMAANFWPQKPEESRSLLSLYLADGKSTLDRGAFAKLIAGVVVTKGAPPKTEVGRRLAAANLFASYALSPFYTVENHWEVVQGWTLTAAHIAWAADNAKLESKAWQPTFRLAVEAALGALDSLVSEALQPRALGPGPFCELDEITRARCTICAGAIAAKLLVTLKAGKEWDSTEQATKAIEDLFKSGRFILWGESAIPFFLTSVWALDETRGNQLSDGILLSLISAICATNCSRLPIKLASPYESADEANARVFRPRFEGEAVRSLQAAASHALSPLVTIAARRLWRNFLASRWSQITKIDAVQLTPDRPRDLLLWDWGHERGTDQSRRFSAPQSWSELLREARVDDSQELPRVLTENFDFSLLFLLCFPHRLFRPLVKYLDAAVHDRPLLS